MAKLIPREDNGQGMKLAYSFIIFIIPLPVTYERHWAIPGKNQTGGVVDMEFPVVSKKEWDFTGFIKNEVEFPRRLTKKK